MRLLSGVNGLVSENHAKLGVDRVRKRIVEKLPGRLRECRYECRCRCRLDRRGEQEVGWD